MDIEKFKSMLKQIKVLNDKLEIKKLRGNNDYNLFVTLLDINDEVRLHSRFIHSLLDPNSPHYQKELFLELVSHFQPFINKPIKRIVIRNSKTRWGSCNHKKGYINLSLRLIEKPLSAVRYVVLHELTHMLYPHHQKSFYDFIEKNMPDYKKQEQILKA